MASTDVHVDAALTVPTASSTPPEPPLSSATALLTAEHEDASIETNARDDTGLDNSAQMSGEPSEQQDEEQTESSGGKQEQERPIETEDSVEDTKELDQEAIARDLDMLANTVRSIATHVVGGEGGEDTDTAVNRGENADTVVALQDAEGSNEAGTSAASDFSLTAPTDGPDEGNSVNNVGGSGAMYSGDELAVLHEIGADAIEAAAEATNEDANGDFVASDGVGTKRSAEEAISTRTPQPKRQKRAEYSEDTRALCVRRHGEGASYAVISKELGIPHDTVRAIVRKVKRTGSVSSAPRSGRPRKTSGIIDKVILEAVRSNKQCSAKSIQVELQQVYGVKVSSETVRRRVLEHTKQRLLAASGGASCDQASSSSVEEAANAPASDMVVDTATAHLSETTAASNPLLDPLTFQQLLHEGEKSTTLTAPTADILTGSPSTAIAASSIDVQPAVQSSNLDPSSVTEVVMQTEGIAEASPPSEDQNQAPSSRPTQKRHKRGEYSVEVREQCVSLHAQGQGYRRIGKSLKMPHTTVRAIVEKAQRTGTVLPAKRSGRPRKTDAIVDKVILQAVEANEKSSARVIQEHLSETFGIRVSCETIRRRVKDHSRQCLSTAASSTIPDTNTIAHEEERPQSQDIIAEAVSESSKLQPEGLPAFDSTSNAVHL